MLDSSHGRGCLSQSLSLLTASCRERHGLAARSPWLPADQPTYPVVTRVTEPKLYFRRQSASCLLSDVGRGDVNPQMRFNRFVFLNRPMLSLEVHLGVIASPQTPCPADFVTLPVSVSHRRFGSFSLAAEKRQALIAKSSSTASQTCSSNAPP